MHNIDLVVDFIFLMDVLLMFVTSFINIRGIESFDSLEIFYQYTSTFRFYSDILALLSIGIIVNLIPWFYYFGIFKTFRVFRLGSMIRRANMDITQKTIANVFKLVFYLFFFLHFIGCYFWVVSLRNAP